MQQIDASAIERLGIPRLLLMEHAGLAVARAAQSLLAPGGTVMLCCGTGFNGGDGLCAARHLAGLGYRVRVLLAGRAEALREEPAVYARILREMGIAMMEIGDAASLAREIAGAGLLIDALLGIGSRGPVREPVASYIREMNRSGKPILAVDVPSGLDADTGLPQGVAVKAAVTVTFGRPKQGCMLGEGPAHAGSLIVDSITIPASLLEAAA